MFWEVSKKSAGSYSLTSSKLTSKNDGARFEIARSGARARRALEKKWARRAPRAARAAPTRARSRP